ncbi:ABC transporter B member 29, chloroplastic [Turnera subulata]|uniref:ABC transporter B member 29, chloroplastic n=1 Tax=Turnera subulata TaxID=218843 RepID=A0A9Q0FZX6_9ROSI|nr:ABC transporter B member 29, chloroplastic [Turnera subulata]
MPIHFHLKPTLSPLLFHHHYHRHEFPSQIQRIKAPHPNLASPPIKLASKPLLHATKPTFLRSLSAIKPFVVSQRSPILRAWLCSLLSTLSLSLLVPRLSRFSSCLGNVGPASLRKDGAVLAALFLAKLAATYWQQSLLWEAALSAGFEMRVFVFERVLGRELGFFEGRSGVSPGDVAYRITAETADIVDTLYALLNTSVPSALQLSAMVTQMLLISPALSLISALVIPCMALAIASLGERLRKISKKAHLSVATLSAYLNEVLPAILFVKANNAEVSEGARFEMLARADLNEHLKKKKMKALMPQLIQVIYFGTLFTLCIGSLLVSRGCFDGCSMVSFVTSLVFLVEPIQDVGKAYNEWKQGEPAIERLLELARSNSMVVEEPEAINMAHVTGDVRFCDLTFKYGDNTVLNGVNLHIKAGETVALVGPSGGGKTTLVKLLLRLYNPTSGCILLDGQNIENIRLESLRRHVSLVSQDITLFTGTVAENIGYRDLMTKIDMEKVEQVAQIANADEFIRLLPKGYQTNIGPRGSSLSGGQKQRLAIARALYQDSSILIMDEATSALDSRSEFLLFCIRVKIGLPCLVDDRGKAIARGKKKREKDNAKLKHSSLPYTGGVYSIRGQVMDATNTPAIFVNGALLPVHVRKRVRTVIQFIGSDRGGAVVGRSTDELQLSIKGSQPSLPPTKFVEVIGIADTDKSIQADTWTNFGDQFAKQLFYRPPMITHIRTISFVSLQTGNINISSSEILGFHSVKLDDGAFDPRPGKVADMCEVAQFCCLFILHLDGYVSTPILVFSVRNH